MCVFECSDYNFSDGLLFVFRHFFDFLQQSGISYESFWVVERFVFHEINKIKTAVVNPFINIRHGIGFIL